MSHCTKKNNIVALGIQTVYQNEMIQIMIHRLIWFVPSSFLVAKFTATCLFHWYSCSDTFCRLHKKIHILDGYTRSNLRTSWDASWDTLKEYTVAMPAFQMRSTFNIYRCLATHCSLKTPISCHTLPSALLSALCSQRVKHNFTHTQPGAWGPNYLNTCHLKPPLLHLTRFWGI